MISFNQPPKRLARNF